MRRVYFNCPCSFYGQTGEFFFRKVGIGIGLSVERNGTRSLYDNRRTEHHMQPMPILLSSPPLLPVQLVGSAGFKGVVSGQGIAGESSTERPQGRVSEAVFAKSVNSLNICKVP